MSEAAKAVNEVILVPSVRVAFAHGLFEKSGFDDNSKQQYSAKFIVEPGSIAARQIEDVKQRVARAKWGKDAEKVLAKAESNDKDRLLKDGDLVTWGGFEGNLYVSANNDDRPSTFDRARNPVAKEDGIIYSGCYANARLEIWAQDNKWGKAVRAKLLGVQFVKDGDSFGSGSAPAKADDFPELDAAGVDDPFA